ncbi:MAG: ABC-2 family transporter protein [Verrucomicrobiales bacterium]|nr:ABC-2 family transporter protein [Verrucomicrobiales bacterium]
MPAASKAPLRSADRFRRLARVYGMLCRNSFIREMNFKVNFVLWLVVELLWFALQLTFIAVIYQHTERIATWSKYEVILLVGASHFIQQIFSAFFLNNCVNLSELVRTGRLDFLLLLPVNTRFLVSFKQLDPGAFINAASAVGVMVYAARQLALVPGLHEILGFLLLCGAGVLVHYSLMFLLATVSFYTVRVSVIISTYYHLFTVARIPLDAFSPGPFKAVFTYAIPMALVANVPAATLVGKLSHPWYPLLLVAVAGMLVAASEWAWRRAVRSYTSASS